MGVLLSVWQVYVTRWRTDKCVEARPGWGRRADTGMCECEYKFVLFMMYSDVNVSSMCTHAHRH